MKTFLITQSQKTFFFPLIIYKVFMLLLPPLSPRNPFYRNCENISLVRIRLIEDGNRI